jgi:UDP-N-acetylmuramate--alanine ligase
MNFEKIYNVYFIGIGGIGMSALARYFNTMGKYVAGFDRTQTTLTDALQSEGISIHFEDSIANIPEKVITEKENTLIIYTPAVPANHNEFSYFRNHGYIIMKRAEVLGFIFSNKKGIGIAGTHGKTTTSTILAHLLKQSNVDCSAFLGGISKNYNSNLMLSNKSEIVVAEADEFDRSFLKLFPYMTIVTSTDADHLDIYGTHAEVLKSFNLFIRQINKGGILIHKKGIQLDISNLESVHIFDYAVDDIADFYPVNLKLIDGLYSFDLQTPNGIVRNLKLGVPGKMNLENSIAAIAASLFVGVSINEIRLGLENFSGVKRRFEYHIKNNNFVYIDDYAHHPEELKACITSVKAIYPTKKITGIFQPHLFSRTRDFAEGFAESLGLLDEVILLDIYPAREEPIPGVSSNIIFDKLTLKNKWLYSKSDLLKFLKTREPEVLITMGAGDIDKLVEPITKLFSKKN